MAGLGFLGGREKKAGSLGEIRKYNIIMYSYYIRKL